MDDRHLDEEKPKQEQGARPKEKQAEAMDTPQSSGRIRCLSSGSSSSSEEENEKRQRVGTPPKGFILPGLAASPPKFISLEQIMKAASGVTNMALAHEIAVDKDFKLQKVEPPENSLQRHVKDIVHKAFWDAFREQLEEDPPTYQHAMILLEEIKEGLLSLLLTHHTKLKDQINEVLDIDLIHHQAEHGALDFDYYAKYIISVMAKLCAPIRDEEIQKLINVQDVVDMYKEILHTLDLMKLDMANFAIQQMRPHIQQHSVEYEKQKFAEFLETQKDGLEFTRSWLYRGMDSLKTEENANKSKPEMVNGPLLGSVINKSYMMLFDWNDNWMFPETLVMDYGRFKDLRNRLQHLTLVASVLLITYSTVGPSIAGLSEFKQKLKQHISLLVDGNEEKRLEEVTENIAVQIVKEVNECLEQHGFSTLDDSRSKALSSQIVEIKDPNHRIFNLVKQRVLEFIGHVLSSSTASPVKVPPGLSSMQSELARITGQFLRLVSHNRAVFGDYYVDIIKSLKASCVQ